MGSRAGVLRAALIVVIAIGVALSFVSGAFAADNTGCLTCHGGSLSVSVPDVDLVTLSGCKACHIPGLVGSHPYHQPGANCATACHTSWGDSLPTAIPWYSDPTGASFASENSKNTSPAVLHIIHSAPRWPANVTTSFSECGSCHQTAACNACHTGAVASAVVGGKAQHGIHSTLGKPASSLPIYPAWTGLIGRGVIGVDQTVNTVATETNQCAAAGCHNLEGTKANRSKIVEDYPYDVGGNPDDLTGTNAAVSYVGTWRVRYHAVYTGGRASANNTLGSQLNATFTGTRVEVITDTDPYRGKAEIWVNGVKEPELIDCYSASTVTGATVFSKQFSSAGPHTISIRPTGTKSTAARGAFILVDGFSVYAGLPDSVAPACTSCHAAQAENHGGDFSHEATHTAGLYSGFDCTDCHSINMFAEHGRASSKTAAASCAACHTVYAGYALNTYDFTCGGTGTVLNGATQPCHSVSEAAHTFTEPTLIDAAHVDTNATPSAALSECWSCHGKNLVTIHSNSVTSNDVKGAAYVTSCLSCHGPTIFPTTADCTNAACHTVTGVHSMATHPAPPHIATNDGQGTVPRTGGKSCSTCHALEIANPAGGEHAKSSSVTDPGGTAIGCVECHAAPYFNSVQPWIGTINNTCIACHKVGSGLPGATTAGEPHELADYTSEHNYDSGLNASCGSSTMTCHSGSTTMLGNIANADTLHAVSKPGNADCTSCHTNNTAVPTQRQCAGCHTSHDTLPAHNSAQTDFATNGDCLPCHANYSNLSFGHAVCAKCHDNDILTAAETRYLQTSFTGECLGCHNATVIGTQAYYTADPNHYNETTHTANIAADTVPTGGAIITGKSCTSCHSSKLKAEHVLTISAGNVNCIDCHTNAISTATINADWLPGKKCANCHGGLHNSLGTSHDMSASAAALSCDGVGCHDGSNIATLHADRVLSTDAAKTSCNVCHADADTALTATACNSAGCHSGAGHTHPLETPPTTSTYSVAAQTGCIASGAGCHVDADTDYASLNYHPDAGCISGPCHTAANHNNTQFDNPNTCQNCHGGGTLLYDNAPDVVATSGLQIADHYNETTHTVTGLANVVRGTTNGAASASCSDCHDDSNATGLNDLWYQHQGIRTGDLTCYGCHNQSVQISALITDDTRTDTCTACHATGTGLVEAQHSSANAPVVNGSSTAGCGATGTNCHTSYDLHDLHKNAAKGCGTSDGTTNMVGCHDFRTQGIKPTIKTCAQVGGCHASYTTNSHAHAADAAKHQPTTLTQANSTTFASTACGACHDIRNSNSSLTLEHTLSTSAKTTDATNVCRNCHNNAASTTAITGNWSTKDTTTACSTCHTGALAIHADSNPTAHSDVTSAGCSNSGTGCHNGADLSAVGPVTTVNTNIHSTCLRCHDRTATAPNLAYNPANDTCGSGRECHAVAGQYNTSTLVHNGGGGPADGTDADHHTAGATQMSATYTYNSKTTACSACHSGVLGTEHGRSTSTLTGTGTTTCEKCHNDSATVSGIVKGSWAAKNTTTSCQSCHANTDGTSAATAHGNVATHASDTSVTGCTGLGAGCHGVDATPDLTTVHTSGCALTRACHSVTTYNVGVKTCTNAACHPSANYNTTTYAHNAVNGTDTTHTVTPASMTTIVGAGGTTTAACSTCHSDKLKTAHNFAAGYATASLSWTNECLGCHNATSPINVAALVAANTWTNSCTGNGCHNTTQKVHVDGGAADAPVVTGTTSITPACDASGCHATMDLHTLHKDSAAGCGGTDENGAGCHNAANIDKAPTQISCGGTAVANGACHAGYVSGSHGISNGGKTCYRCHSAYQTNMEDGLGTITGSSRANSVHHVMGSATQDGDIAPNAGTYPTSQTDVFCVSCHTDHNYFNANKGANLRSDIATTSGAAPVNTDFSATAPYGICVSCHSVARAKQGMGTDQLDVGGANTPAIDGVAFGTSAHNYNVASSFGASTFNANCSKCHSDEQIKQYQTSTYKFGTHYSAASAILGALGVSLADAYVEEDECYACHSLAASGRKSTDNFDWYGGRAMNATSQGIHGLMASTPASAQTSTNQLYFRPTADGAPAEPMPNLHQTGDTFQGGTWIGRLMAPNQTATAYETKNQTTNASGTLRWRMVTFTSPPVATGVTVPAGSWTLNINAQESDAAQNAYIRYMVYTWNAADTAGTTIVAAGTYNTEIGTVAAPGTAYVIPLTGSAVTLAAGDKLSVCVELETGQTVTTSYIGSFYWGSGAASSLQMPSAVNFTWNTPAITPVSAHNLGAYSGLHKPSPADETRTYISANKHVECADCHNVHASSTTRHTPAGVADANGNNVSGVLTGVPGVTVTFSANNWTAPTYTTALGTATKEYQICFKCHSGYNTNVTSWGGAGAAAWTDQGFEFSPQNQSYHPVVAALPATDPGVNGSSRLVADNMRAAGTAGGMAVGGWSVGDTMYCSDCHAEGSTGSLGPHGSAVKWMLKGPNKAWPYTTAAGNGTSTGTFRAISAWATDDGTANGLFCYNCHVANASSATTRHLTSEYNHASYVCVACHIRVPHGGKVSRLMKAASTQTNLPARYMSDGNGGNVQAYFLTRFVKRAPNAYAIADCGVGGTTCYNSHNTTTGETW